MTSAAIIRDEMASAVRALGAGGVNAKDETRVASRLSGLPASVIDRLRYQKIERPFADVVDAVRAALKRKRENDEARAKHERFLLEQRVASLEARLMGVDPDFYGDQVRVLRSVADGARNIDGERV